jgi:hypothetical protein
MLEYQPDVKNGIREIRWFSWDYYWQENEFPADENIDRNLSMFQLIQGIQISWVVDNCQIRRSFEAVHHSKYLGGNESHEPPPLNLEDGRGDSYLVNVVWDSTLTHDPWHIPILPSTRETLIKGGLN